MARKKKATEDVENLVELTENLNDSVNEEAEKYEITIKSLNEDIKDKDDVIKSLNGEIKELNDVIKDLNVTLSSLNKENKSDKILISDLEDKIRSMAEKEHENVIIKTVNKSQKLYKDPIYKIGQTVFNQGDLSLPYIIKTVMGRSLNGEILYKIYAEARGTEKTVLESNLDIKPIY